MKYKSECLKHLNPRRRLPPALPKDGNNRTDKEKLNHIAYKDVLDCKEPSMPDIREYMRYYNFWRPLQHFPGDDLD